MITQQVKTTDIFLGTVVKHTHPEVVALVNNPSSGGGMTWSIITNDADAVNNNGYFIDATNNTVTLTLPVTPTINQQVGVRVLDITNTVTIARNGSNIEKSATDLVINVAGTGIT